MKHTPLLLLLLTLSACSSKREIMEKYPDGRPKKIMVRIDQNRYTIDEIYPDGNLKDRQPYKNGLQDSIRIHYSEEGKKIAEMSFRDGVRNGVTHEFYKSGQMAFEGTCVNGKFEGLSTWYFPNGKPQTIGYRHLDKDTGRWSYFDTTGAPTRSIHHNEAGASTEFTYYNGRGAEISKEEYDKIPDRVNLNYY